MNRPEARRLLKIELATAFVTSPSGRMLRKTDPDGTAAPNMILAGCADGNILLLNQTIDERTATAIEALAEQEPALDRANSMPRFAERYRELLSVSEPLSEGDFGLSFRLPNDIAWNDAVVIVRHGTPEGDALCARLTRDGLPQSLIAMGFADLSHFWEPWCVALDGDEIASIAFAARLGDQGAALGLATMPEFRGRGLGAAATAGWSALPALKDRVLFYGTDRDNVSSQRVTERLDLEFFGSSLRL
ncbi:MAG TPA: hypothetical protein VII56_14750 [Rhizomicrobium sp.]